MLKCRNWLNEKESAFVHLQTPIKRWLQASHKTYCSVQANGTKQMAPDSCHSSTELHCFVQAGVINIHGPQGPWIWSCCKLTQPRSYFWCYERRLTIHSSIHKPSYINEITFEMAVDEDLGRPYRPVRINSSAAFSSPRAWLSAFRIDALWNPMSISLFTCWIRCCVNSGKNISIHGKTWKRVDLQRHLEPWCAGFTHQQALC